MKKLVKVMLGLVGVAAVAGAGYLAYDHFMGSEEVDQDVIVNDDEVTTENETPVETEVKTVVDDVDTTESEL